RDDCGFLPLTSSITVVLPPVLVAGAPVTDADAGTVDIPVSMPACPAVVVPLYVRVQVSGQPLVHEDGSVRELRVDPQCQTRVEHVGCSCGAGPGAPAFLAAALLVALVSLRSPRRTPVG